MPGVDHLDDEGAGFVGEYLATLRIRHLQPAGQNVGIAREAVLVVGQDGSRSDGVDGGDHFGACRRIDSLTAGSCTRSRDLPDDNAEVLVGGRRLEADQEPDCRTEHMKHAPEYSLRTVTRRRGGTEVALVLPR